MQHQAIQHGTKKKTIYSFANTITNARSYMRAAPGKNQFKINKIPASREEGDILYALNMEIQNDERLCAVHIVKPAIVPISGVALACECAVMGVLRLRCSELYFYIHTSFPSRLHACSLTRYLYSSRSTLYTTLV